MVVSIIFINAYVRQQRELVKEQAKRVIERIQANQVAVLMAKDDIPKGTVIESSLLETAIVPGEYVQPQAVTSLDRISGMVVIAPISKGEQITLSKLTSQQVQAGGSLAMVTPIGTRAITIPVDNISSLVGMIKPGDYVDVIGMMPVPVQTAEGKVASQVVTLPLFQRVLVLAVGQETGVALAPQESRYKKEEKREISSLITLALKPQEANFMAFVQEQGKLRLILRSPADSQVQPVQPASWDTLFQYIMPAAPQRESEVKTEPQPNEYVEIYRGVNKEKVLLSK